MANKKFFRFNLAWLYGGILIVLVIFYLTNNQSYSKEVNSTRFEEIALGGGMKEIVIYKDHAEAQLTDSAKRVIFGNETTENTPGIIKTNIPSSDSFAESVSCASAWSL